MNPIFRSALVAATLALAAPVLAQAPAAKKPAAPATAPASNKAKVSTMIAMDVARSLEPIKDEIDVTAFARAFALALHGKPTGLSEDEANRIRAEFGQAVQSKLAAKAAAQAQSNLANGDAFLAANKAKPGIRTTESGVQYQVLRAGSGARPSATDTVRVHYRGTTLDGKVFDSSYDRGQPAEFALNQVIPGWTEGLQLMPVGSKYKLWIPAKLAYGPNGPPQIGPNAMLTFEVELLAIVK